MTHHKMSSWKRVDIPKLDPQASGGMKIEKTGFLLGIIWEDTGKGLPFLLSPPKWENTAPLLWNYCNCICPLRPQQVLAPGGADKGETEGSRGRSRSQREEKSYGIGKASFFSILKQKEVNLVTLLIVNVINLVFTVTRLSSIIYSLGVCIRAG